MFRVGAQQFEIKPTVVTGVVSGFQDYLSFEANKTMNIKGIKEKNICLRKEINKRNGASSRTLIKFPGKVTLA